MAGWRRIGGGLCLFLSLGFSTVNVAWAQGAGDNQGERQVDPQIIQNPIIPGLVDPEPPFTTAKQDAVLNRPRPEYDPIGIEAGGVIRDIKYLGRGQILESFLLFPKVETEILFDSNILASENNPIADFIGTVRPELELHSNWDNHEFFIRGFGEFGRFLSNSRENFRRHGVEVGARLDITEFTFLKVGGGWQRRTSARGDVATDAGGDEPTVFYETFASAEMFYKADKLSLGGLSKFTVRDFVDTPAAGGEIENDQNDFWLWNNTLRIGWEEWRGTTLFVEPFFNLARNFQRFDNVGIERGFASAGLSAGFTYDLTAVTFFEGSLGFGYAMPHDRNSNNFLFVDGGLDLIWNPHDSWTFTAGWDREITSTNSFTNINGVNVSDTAFLTDTIDLGAQLEITYELLASLNTTLKLADTLENGTSDISIDNELALLWLMNEHMRLRTFWRFNTLTSNDATREFSKHQLGLVLTLHY